MTNEQFTFVKSDIYIFIYLYTHIRTHIYTHLLVIVQADQRNGYNIEIMNTFL